MNRPNVLIITGDDLGTRLGVYGSDTVRTPHIDQFAASALLFEECHCQIPICGPSRVSILTGLRPETTGVLQLTDQWRPAAPDAVTLPRHFRDSGYRTYAIGKIEDPRNGDLDDAWEDVANPRQIAGVGQVVQFLAQVASDVADNDRPFFLAVGFDEPHCPWSPSEEALAAYTREDVAAELGPGRNVGRGYLERCIPELLDEIGGTDPPADRVVLSEEQAETIALDYLASVTDLDRMIGEVLERAAELGLLDNTIVVVWSGDHGYALGDPNWGKWLPHGANTRVPLLMRLPDGRGAGQRVPGLVETVDMYPTLIDLCGLTAPNQELDGVSFAPMFDDPANEGKPYVYSRFGIKRAVADQRWNLVHDDFWEVDSLFDRTNDAWEVVDVAAEHPEKVIELRAVLDEGPPRGVTS